MSNRPTHCLNPGCGKSIEQARRGPARKTCSDACRQALRRTLHPEVVVLNFSRIGRGHWEVGEAIMDTVAGRSTPTEGEPYRIVTEHLLTTIERTLRVFNTPEEQAAIWTVVRRWAAKHRADRLSDHLNPVITRLKAAAK